MVASKLVARCLLGGAFTAISLMWSPFTSAGSFAVSPVRATLSASQTVNALTVTNTGSAPTVVQLEAMAWSQQDGQDVYVPTREILATPPIFTIPAGGSQVVRVGLRRAPDAQRELSYRLYLQEAPPPPRAGFRGLNVALRIGVPVFVSPATEQTPGLAWRLDRSANGQLEGNVTNHGNAHVQLTQLKLLSDQGDELGKQAAAAYVLPGQSRRLPLPGKLTAQKRLRVLAQTDDKDMDSGLLTVGAEQ